MGKMKQLPATASATHDWAHLTHAAAAVHSSEPPKNLNNTILLLTDTTDCIYNHCQCRSSIFYDMAEVLQQDAIDLIFLTTAWDYDLPIVELSSYQLFRPAPD